MVILFRFVLSVLSFTGKKAHSLVFWNIFSSILFFSFFLSGMLNVFIVCIADDLTIRVFSVLMITFEIILNTISILITMIFAYQTILSSKKNQSLNISDPQKEILEFIFRGYRSYVKVEF